MKIKTSELTGDALDWAVALIEYPEWKEQGYLEVFPYDLHFDDGEVYSPSTDWAQGGPIIEREGIDLHRVTSSLWSASWWANNSGMANNPAQRFKHNVRTDGPTPLIAAMRCYVASKLGEEVEIPDELLEFA